MPDPSDLPQWGLFTAGGEPVVVCDSVVAVGFLSEARVSQYPVERGGFQSFNKVAAPGETRVTFTVGGSAERRTRFLTDVEAALKSLDVYTLITPEVSYASQSLVHYDYRRTDRAGVSLLTVEAQLTEIRDSVKSAFSSSKVREPASADAENVGPVQAEPASGQPVPIDPALPGAPDPLA